MNSLLTTSEYQISRCSPEHQHTKSGQVRKRRGNKTSWCATVLFDYSWNFRSVSKAPLWI